MILVCMLGYGAKIQMTVSYQAMKKDTVQTSNTALSIVNP